MNSRKIISTIIGVLLIIGAVFLAKKIVDSKNVPKPRPNKVIKTVLVDTVINGTVPIIVSANGNLVAQRRMELYSEVQGVFKRGSKLFKTGQEYKAGEKLIGISSAEYYASVQSAKSNLYNLITSIMPDLRLDYPDIYPKWEAYLRSFDMDKGTPPLPDMSSEKEKFFISGRGILTNYYNVKNMEQRLSKFNITAPYNGILTDALVTEGTLVRAGQKLGEFINVGTYELEVAVSKVHGELLKIGESVELVNLDRTKTYEGKVIRVNGRVDQASQTVTAFIEVKSKELKEGMYLEANLNAKEETNAIEIDRSLLLQSQQIFVVRDSVLDVIDVRPVFFSDKTVVLKNIPDGTKIIKKPVVGAYAGMLVQIFDENSTSNNINTTE